VWGKDFDGLNYAEPWVLLAVSVLVSTCSIKYVLLAPGETDEGDSAAAAKKNQ
jgi:hypothetical protein